MRNLSDIEDFTTDQLRAEILRREAADLDGRCWYCGHHLAAHTCKYAIASTPVPGWEVKPPRFVRTEDCMANEVEYWQVNARNPVTGEHAIGNGETAEAATAKCIESIRRRRA